MSDINVFMHAIQVALQSTLNNAIATAVAEAIKPLLERITALENNPAIGVDTTLEARVKVLEEKPAVSIDEAKMVEAFNSQEWFWEKINGFVESRVGEAMDDHTSSYDHDEYDEMHNEWGCETTSEFVRDNDLDEKIEERVNDVLRNASFSISI